MAGDYEQLGKNLQGNSTEKNTPATPSTSGKKKTAPMTFLGEAQLPSGARNGGNCRVIRPSGASLVARIPSHITVRDRDTVRVQREPTESTAIAAKGTFLIIENLDHSPQANPVSDVSVNAGFTVGGSTSGSAGSGSGLVGAPYVRIYAYGDASSTPGSLSQAATLNSLNENRAVLRDVQARMITLEGWLDDLASRFNTLRSMVLTEQTRNSENASRIGGVEASLNYTKDAVEATKNVTNQVGRAIKRAGIGFADVDYGGGVVSGMVTRRNMMTDYARVRVNSDNEENAFVGSFHDLQRGDYVKVNTSGGSGTWYIEDYMDPADIGLD